MNNQPTNPAGFFDEQITAQIQHVMDKCENDVHIYAVLNHECALSKQIRDFLSELSGINKKISVHILDAGENAQIEAMINTQHYPVMALFDKEKHYSGIAYHALPMGHELESFMLAIYNVAGPGQALSEALKARIENIQSATHMKVGITLTCPMCPEMVQTCQQIALYNKNITAEIFDLAHFPELKKKYKVMSVPVVIVNDEKVLFGKTDMMEMVTYLERT